MCAQVAPSGECLRGKGPPDRIVGNTWGRRFWQPTPSGLNLAVADVLRVCRFIVALRGRLLYNTKVERFVLNILNEDYYYYSHGVTLTGVSGRLHAVLNAAARLV